MSRTAFSYLSISIVFSILFILIHCAEDKSGVYLNSISQNSDSSRLSIATVVSDATDRENIFKYAKTLYVEMEGVYETKQIISKMTKIGNYFLSNPLKVFPNKNYTITRALILDENQSVIAIAPIKGSIYDNYVPSLPKTFTSKPSGNLNITLEFVPALNGDLELTGYDYSIFGKTTLPSIKMEIKVVDANNFSTPVSSKVTIRKSSNSIPVVPTQIQNSGVYTFEFNYFTNSELFIIEAEGYTVNGTKYFSEERSAEFIEDMYDAGKKPYEIKLK